MSYEFTGLPDIMSNGFLKRKYLIVSDVLSGIWKSVISIPANLGHFLHFSQFSHPTGPLLPFFPNNIQMCNITSWVQVFIHCHKLPGLSVHFLQFILIPLKYSNTITSYWRLKCLAPLSCSFHSVYSSKSILPSWNTHSCTYLSIVVLFCHSLISFSSIPWYLYLSSIFLIFSPLANSITSVVLSFPLFIIIAPRINTKLSSLDTRYHVQ